MGRERRLDGLVNVMLIGSRAIPKHILNRPVVGDWDYIICAEQFDEFLEWVGEHKKKPISGTKWLVRTPERLLEVELAYKGSAARSLCENWSMIGTASASVCLDFKLSHRYLKNSPHFLKTMRDIRSLRAAGVEINSQEFIEQREAETYDYDHPNLGRSKDDFFNGNGVEYVYDHDSIHKAVALGDAPAYTEYAVDGEEVKSDMKKFAACSYEVQLAGVYEETCVLALERSVIPFGTPIDTAFTKALEKVCTSITSGAFREFAWENYDQVIELYQDYSGNYLADLFRGVRDGVVKPIPHQEPF